MMPWTQKSSVNLDAEDYAGWCLRFQQRAFPGSPVTYFPTARAAWDGTPFRHEEQPDGSAIVPISFSWVGSINGVRQDWGHAAVFVPGRGVLSSPGSGYGQQWFGSIDECARFFGATYLGWTEDVGGYRVVDYVPAPTPAPPAPKPSGTTCTVEPWPAQTSTLWGISEKFYGDPTRWSEIYDANIDTIGSNPSLIQPGMVLTIPGV
jgi:hypothetical protein